MGVGRITEKKMVRVQCTQNSYVDASLHLQVVTTGKCRILTMWLQSDKNNIGVCL